MYEIFKKIKNIMLIEFHNFYQNKIKKKMKNKNIIFNLFISITL